MIRRLLLSRHSILFVLMSLLICGCAGKLFVGTPPPAGSSESMNRSIEKKDRLIALAHMDLHTAQGHYPVRAALVLQRPSYLRLEILPVIGTPDFYLTASPDRMSIFIPSRAEFYSGNPSGENLARFLPWALSIEEIVMILSSARSPFDDQNVANDRYQEGNLIRVELKKPPGHSQTVWMEKNGRVAKLVRYDSDGKEIYQVRYADYMEDSPLAKSIRIQWADSPISVSVKYSDLKVEQATDLSVFELTAPAGIKTIQLD